jgi:hypothetical protein
MQKLAWLGITAILVGILVLTFGYFWSEEHAAHYHPFGSFLAINIGGLLVFTAGYTLLSEFWLKRDFARQMSSSIDAKIQTMQLHQSIEDSGISEVFQKFNDDLLLRRLTSASSVKMLVMRNDTFFRANHEELKARIVASSLRLEVMLPDPRNATLMAALSIRYSDLQGPQKLGDSIAASINTWLREQIWNKCTADQQRLLTVRLSDKYPLYSAYLFDNIELWYIPYHYRKNWHPIPVFVYRRNISGLEVYKDLEELFGTASYDMSKAL